MRIIQDSEDEDDLELAGDATVAPTTENASPKQNNTPQFDERGTGSTESLKRTIEAAHRAHFQSRSGTSPDQQNALDPSVSVQHMNHKRSALPLEASPTQLQPAAKSILLTGERPPRSSNQPSEQSDGATNRKQTEAAASMPWHFQGTIGEEWQHHEPIGLFPEPSSTVPNATATQQQLLDEVLDPAFLGLDAGSDAPRYEPAKSSVPWSEYLKSSCRNTEDRAEPTHQPQSSSEKLHSPHIESEPVDASVNVTPAIVPQLPGSQQDCRNSIDQLKGSLLGSEILYDVVDSREAMAPSLTIRQGTHEKVPLNGGAIASTNDGMISDSNTAVHESSGSRHNGELGGNAIRSTPAAKANQKTDSVPEFEEDLQAIGIPKEQYKPRPSRSRSLKITEAEPIDYSIRPEKAARKTRRSRTTGALEVSSTVITPRKVQQICDMGFTPSTTQRALEKNNGDVTNTVNWLIANGPTDEDELAPPRSSKSKRKEKRSDKEIIQDPPMATGHVEAFAPDNRDGMPSNTSAETDPESPVGNEQTLLGVLEDQPTNRVVSKSPRVRVVIPRSKEPPKIEEQQPSTTDCVKHDSIETPGRKAKRRKTDSSHTEPALDHPQASIIDTPKEKKRGRGRPRKEPQLAESVVQEQIGNLETTGKETATTSQEVQSRESPTMELPTLTDERKTEEGRVAVQCTADAPRATPAPVLEETSRTLETPSKPATSGHSPLNKGKVNYRVGLSKRARIAPLLRIMKK